MAPFLPVRRLCITVLLNLFSSLAVYSQGIIFSDSLGAFENNTFCAVAGINNQYTLIECLPTASPLVLTLDTNCRLLKKESLPFIPPGGFIKSALPGNTPYWTILWQTLEGRTWSLHYTWMSDTGNTPVRSAVIDSSELNPGVRRSPYFIRESPDHLYQLLFRRSIPAADKDLLQVELIVIRTADGQVRKAGLSLPFTREFDITGDVVITDQGNVFTTVFDNPLNFRYSSTIHLYQFDAAANRQTEYPLIVSKEKKPTGILIQPGEKEGDLLLLSLYYDFFAKNVNGLSGTVVHQATRQADSLFYYEFPKTLKKEINKYISGLSNDKAMNLLELKECRFSKDRHITVLLELAYQSFTFFGNNDINARSSRSPVTAAPNYGMPAQQISAGMSVAGGRRGGRNGQFSGQPMASSMQPRALSANDGSLPGDIQQQGTGIPASFAIPPIQHVTVLASFDGQFQIASKKVVQNRLTAGLNYIAPYNSLKNGMLQQLAFDLRSNGRKVNQSEAGFSSDSLLQVQYVLVPHHIPLLAHPGAFSNHSTLLTFYQNSINNSYGLAKFSW